jgi:hypothetical protein
MSGAMEGSWAMCCILGQVVAAVVACCPWCVVCGGASCGVLAVGVQIRVAVVVVAVVVVVVVSWVGVLYDMVAWGGQ